MEYSWIKPGHENEKQALNKISEDASKKVEDFDNTPTKKVLDDETQKYISDRVPKTNDDLLQEDIAKKFVLDGNYLQELHNKQNKGEKIEKETFNELWNVYGRLMEIGGYIEVHKDLNKTVEQMIHNINILELKNEISEKFPLAKSGISNKEALELANAEARNIKKELDNMKDESITKESIGELLDKYKDITEKYQELYSVVSPQNPSEN
ncbi:MAG: hypothetical protein NTW62_01695 [Candidatus Nomurabacteria bacterium]|nr:hypothetical protein [Candidatus Nomurabacteria bacterium]